MDGNQLVKAYALDSKGEREENPCFAGTLKQVDRWLRSWKAAIFVPDNRFGGCLDGYYLNSHRGSSWVVDLVADDEIVEISHKNAIVNISPGANA